MHNVSELRRRFEQITGSDQIAVKDLQADLEAAMREQGRGCPAHDSLKAMRDALKEKAQRAELERVLGNLLIVSAGLQRTLKTLRRR